VDNALGLDYKPRPTVTGPAGRRQSHWLKRQFQPSVSIYEGRFRLQVVVRDNNVDQALRALKKKLQREGVFREMKLRNYYEKPSEKKARQKAEAVRRARKLARKRAQREGGLPAAPAAGSAATARPAREARP
jgi:small subunit ribosomal protein S21